MKTRQLSLCAVALLWAMTSTHAADKDAPQDLIVGRWNLVSGGEKGTVEFDADGNYKMTKGTTVVSGRYSFVDAGAIQTRVGERKSTSQVTVTKDELKLVNEAGKVLRFSRVK